MKIKPEEVVEAFAETGLKPAQRLYFKDGCACGLTALYAKQYGGEIPMMKCSIDYPDSIKILRGFDEKYGHEYVDGFMAGFDGTLNYRYNSATYMEGFHDGIAAWIALIEKGMTK